MGWKIENKFKSIYSIYYSMREKKYDMYNFDEANEF